MAVNRWSPGCCCGGGVDCQIAFRQFEFGDTLTPWTVHSGSWSTGAGQLTNTGGGLITYDTNNNDIFSVMRCTFMADQADAEIHFILNWVDSNNYVFLKVPYNAAGAMGDQGIYHKIAGVDNLIGSTVKTSTILHSRPAPERHYMCFSTKGAGTKYTHVESSVRAAPHSTPPWGWYITAIREAYTANHNSAKTAGIYIPTNAGLVTTIDDWFFGVDDSIDAACENCSVCEWLIDDWATIDGLAANALDPKWTVNAGSARNESSGTTFVTQFEIDPSSEIESVVLHPDSSSQSWWITFEINGGFFGGAGERTMEVGDKLEIHFDRVDANNGYWAEFESTGISMIARIYRRAGGVDTLKAQGFAGSVGYQRMIVCANPSTGHVSAYQEDPDLFLATYGVSADFSPHGGRKLAIGTPANASVVRRGRLEVSRTSKPSSFDTCYVCEDLR